MITVGRLGRKAVEAVAPLEDYLRVKRVTSNTPYNTSACLWFTHIYCVQNLYYEEKNKICTKKASNVRVRTYQLVESGHVISPLLGVETHWFVSRRVPHRIESHALPATPY